MKAWYRYYGAPLSCISHACQCTYSPSEFNVMKMEMDERVAVARGWQQVELGRRAGGGVEPGWAVRKSRKRCCLSAPPSYAQALIARPALFPTFFFFSTNDLEETRDMSWPASKTHTTLSSTLHLRDDHKSQRWDSSRSQLSTANDSLLGRLSKSAQKVWPSSSVLPLTASTPRRDSNSEKSRPLLRSSTIRSSISTLPARTSFTMPSPETMRFVFLCSLWYTSSALSSNTGKQILNQFKYPVSLTFVQFGFVAGYCLLFMSPVVRFTTLRRPTKRILTDTLPMGLFQVGGHIFSSMAISRIPVSTVHTIKVRYSPLFLLLLSVLLWPSIRSTHTKAGCCLCGAHIHPGAFLLHSNVIDAAVQPALE